MNHSQIIGNDCRKRAAKKWGAGWPMLSEEQQKGAIALEVISVVFACAPAIPDPALEHIKIVGRQALYPDGQ